MKILLKDTFKAISGGGLSHKYHNTTLALNTPYDMEGFKITYLGDRVLNLDNSKVVVQNNPSEYHRFYQSDNYLTSSLYETLNDHGKAWSFTISFGDDNIPHLEGISILST